MELEPELETIQILVLQSTAFCNIDCDYCYLPDRGVKGTMGERVLERIAEQIVLSKHWRNDSLLLWHAGEPMSCGPDWYKRAHSLLRGSPPRSMRIQFQSNGTLLDHRWIALLRNSGAWLGLSIDGPKWLHDRHRRDRVGRPTFDRVMDAVRLLRQENIPFTAIAVVTKDALDHADEIFEFFAALKPERIGFSVEEAEGANARSTLYRPELIQKVETFFQRIAELNFAQSEPLRIREVESVLAGLIAPPGRKGVSQETRLGWIVTIGTNGDVALFSPELLTTRQASGEFATVGNILKQDFSTILYGERTRNLAIEIGKGVGLCRSTCSYFAHCGGGSPANKYFETQRFDVSETWYCRVSKQATVRGVLRAIGGTAGRVERFQAERSSAERCPSHSAE